MRDERKTIVEFGDEPIEEKRKLEFIKAYQAEQREKRRKLIVILKWLGGFASTVVAALLALWLARLLGI